MLPRLQKAIGDEGILFAQTMSRDAQGMVEEAKRLRDAIPGIVVKIPVTSEGLAAIKLLKKEGITTLGTAVYRRRTRVISRTGRGKIRCSVC